MRFPDGKRCRGWKEVAAIHSNFEFAVVLAQWLRKHAGFDGASSAAKLNGDRWFTRYCSDNQLRVGGVSSIGMEAPRHHFRCGRVPPSLHPKAGNAPKMLPHGRRK